jgi:hypothetical protein
MSKRDKVTVIVRTHLREVFIREIHVIRGRIRR